MSKPVDEYLCCGDPLCHDSIEGLKARLKKAENVIHAVGIYLVADGVLKPQCFELAKEVIQDWKKEIL